MKTLHGTLCPTFILPVDNYLLDLHLEEAELLGEVTGVLLALGGGLLGVLLVGGDELGGGVLVLKLEDAEDGVSEAVVLVVDASLHNPDPALLVGLDLVTVAHLLKEVHHGAELGLVLHGGGLLGGGVEDLLEGGVVGGEVGRAVHDIHADEHLTSLIVVLASLDLLDPGSSVGVHLVAEEIVLLGGGEAGRNGGGHRHGGDTTHHLGITGGKIM